MIKRSDRLEGRSHPAAVALTWTPGWIAQLHYLKHLAIIDATDLFGEVRAGAGQR